MPISVPLSRANKPGDLVQTATVKTGCRRRNPHWLHTGTEVEYTASKSDPKIRNQILRLHFQKEGCCGIYRPGPPLPGWLVFKMPWSGRSHVYTRTIPWEQVTFLLPRLQVTASLGDARLIGTGKIDPSPVCWTQPSRSQRRGCMNRKDIRLHVTTPLEFPCMKAPRGTCADNIMTWICMHFYEACRNRARPGEEVQTLRLPG
ncbi:hypothetical protein F4801DRAFT_495275 [Xylaria longipes]|nr:hypothetical protein F4801DRAFT_495275 [Xylaria longipes]